jgi:hypothetical protein
MLEKALWCYNDELYIMTLNTNICNCNKKFEDFSLYQDSSFDYSSQRLLSLLRQFQSPLISSCLQHVSVAYRHLKLAGLYRVCILQAVTFLLYLVDKFLIRLYSVR